MSRETDLTRQGATADAAARRLHVMHEGHLLRQRYAEISSGAA